MLIVNYMLEYDIDCIYSQNTKIFSHVFQWTTI